MKIGDKAVYRIWLTDEEVSRCNCKKTLDVEFDVIESGAFHYGNGTATVFKITDDRNEQVYDTRYWTSTFPHLCQRIIEDYFGSNCEKAEEITPNV